MALLWTLNTRVWSVVKVQSETTDTYPIYIGKLWGTTIRTDTLVIIEKCVIWARCTARNIAGCAIWTCYTLIIDDCIACCTKTTSVVSFEGCLKTGTNRTSIVNYIDTEGIRVTVETAAGIAVTFNRARCAYAVHIIIIVCTRLRQRFALASLFSEFVWISTYTAIIEIHVW
jgi:hypothetical protein